jgi:peptidoglycan hydrolase-like protein with peptidoglycan-binding domain
LGPRTRNAIFAFQRSHGAAAIGEVDGGLLVNLVTEVKQRFGRNSVADTRLVQRLLVIKGFNPGDADGLVGPRTRAAIAAFAEAQGGLPTETEGARLLATLLASGDNGVRSGR